MELPVPPRAVEDVQDNQAGLQPIMPLVQLLCQQLAVLINESLQ
jgi:hypothetical protein